MKESLHVVFKINKVKLRSRSLRSSICFGLAQAIIKQYSRRFFVKIEQMSIQNDHIHLLVRTHRRSQFHYFFRVVAGQIAQRFEQEGLFAVTGTPSAPKLGGEGSTKLWMYRPFSRVVRGRKAYKTMRDYIQLNEKEALGKIPYRKERLRGLTKQEYEELWN